ncbi:MAG: M14 family zinc carboxypeptidase [Bdellovibrionota bacterium]
MKFVLIALLTALTSSFAFAQEQFDVNRYHSVAQINNYLEKVAEEHIQIESRVLGQSEEGIDIKYLIVSDGQIKNPIFLNGTHHGDEKSSTNAILAIIQYIKTNIEEESIANVLRQHSIVLLPLVNPDGYSANTRENANGYDINRDYSYLDHNPQNTGEARLIMDLSHEFQFVAAMSYHSGMEGVLWPYGYTGERPQDHLLFKNIGESIAQAMGFTTAVQSYYDYKTIGEYIDFSYIEFGTISLTVEVSEDKAPSESELRSVNAKVIKGLNTFLSNILSRDPR